MTDPGAAVWRPPPTGGRTSAVSRTIGTGSETWDRARRGVLTWAVKTRSGFVVDDTRPVAPGRRITIFAGCGPLRVPEPVEVVEVVSTPDRAGFSYRTRQGHPVSGEEAFIVHRDGDDVVLTVRSVTRAAPSGVWRAAFPLLLVVQRVVRRRYLRALS